MLDTPIQESRRNQRGHLISQERDQSDDRLESKSDPGSRNNKKGVQQTANQFDERVGITSLRFPPCARQNLHIEVIDLSSGTGGFGIAFLHRHPKEAWPPFSRLWVNRGPAKETNSSTSIQGSPAASGSWSDTFSRRTKAFQWPRPAGGQPIHV